jgi:hypothetical protein
MLKEPHPAAILPATAMATAAAATATTAAGGSGGGVSACIGGALMGGSSAGASGGWAAITAANSQKWDVRQQAQRPQPKKVRIPQALWVADTQRNPALFNIADPLVRYKEVNKFCAIAGVVDLHFQSTKTVSVVLDSELPKELSGKEGKAWVITGTGHHVSKKTHQKAGALFPAVEQYLQGEGYTYAIGVDPKGKSGAFLVYSS